MNLSQSTPGAEPISSTEVEESLGLDSGQDSTTIASYIGEAWRAVEADTGRSLINRNITLTLDNWPIANSKQAIYLPKGPVSSVTSVKYYDTNGSQQTMTVNTDYRVAISGDSARIEPISSWPSLVSDANTGRTQDIVEVIYVAGYGAAATDVPDDLVTACLIQVDMIYSKGEINSHMAYDRIIQRNYLEFNHRIND